MDGKTARRSIAIAFSLLAAACGNARTSERAAPQSSTPSTPLADAGKYVLDLADALARGDAGWLAANVSFPLPLGVVTYDMEVGVRTTAIQDAAALLQAADGARIDPGFLHQLQEGGAPERLLAGREVCDGGGAGRVDWTHGAPAFDVAGDELIITFPGEICSATAHYRHLTLAWKAARWTLVAVTASADQGASAENAPGSPRLAPFLSRLGGLSAR
jgi:hypothetical protein